MKKLPVDLSKQKVRNIYAESNEEKAKRLEAESLKKKKKKRINLKDLKLSIDGESVGICIDDGSDDEPIHVVFWHIDEVEEDADVAISMVKAVQLFYTNPKKLLKLVGVS